MDKIVNRMTDSYFDLSLVEIQDIEQLIFASSAPNPTAGRVENYNVLVLRTTKDNANGFDMVTQKR